MQKTTFATTADHVGEPFILPAQGENKECSNADLSPDRFAPGFRKWVLRLSSFDHRPVRDEIVEYCVPDIYGSNMCVFAEFFDTNTIN